MKRTLAILVASLPALAFGQDADSGHPYLSKKFYGSIGLFRPDQRLELGLDGSIEIPDPQPSPHLDFSQTFGITDSHDTGSAEFGWRFGEKWMFRGQYFRVDGKARATLEEDVEWGDYIFNEGSSIGTGTDFQITRLFFGREFSSSNSHEFGIGIGAHILDISAYINGNATINGVDAGFIQERASISQPLPNFGLWYLKSFSQKWAVGIRFDWLDANIDRYDGHIVNSAASIGYAVTDHFGIGLAYNFFEIDLKINDSNWDGRITSRFDGPFISLTGYW